MEVNYYLTISAWVENEEGDIIKVAPDEDTGLRLNNLLDELGEVTTLSEEDDQWYYDGYFTTLDLSKLEDYFEEYDVELTLKS